LSYFLWWIFFEIGCWELFAQGWLRTEILLIYASWVARITGMSHQGACPWRSNSLNTKVYILMS
jgi:hypothetical protein